MEHAISEELEDRIDQLLGHPTTDPHGSPIPSKAGKVNNSSSKKLSEMKRGEKAKIAEVRDEDSELLRYVGELGLFPGKLFEVVNVAPYKGPMTLKIKSKKIIVGREAAKQILVNKISAWN